MPLMQGFIQWGGGGDREEASPLKHSTSIKLSSMKSQQYTKSNYYYFVSALKSYVKQSVDIKKFPKKHIPKPS